MNWLKLRLITSMLGISVKNDKVKCGTLSFRKISPFEQCASSLYLCVCVCVCVSWLDSPVRLSPPHCSGFEMDSFRHNPLGWNSLDERSARRKDLYLITQNFPNRQTDIHVPGGFRTSHPSKQAAAGPHLRHRGHRDRGVAYYLRILWEAYLIPELIFPL